ncbi:hypothetical protein [Vagococcus acidifermentans]|uniref:Uncharacterized protein n=1 Tax=Vagococcus acidifermentans TaxID=564710 RepID=A0A430AXW2_9ENTE|nr:hypothetical protein CBF27_04920 [Vagococcus acidifermentans]
MATQAADGSARYRNAVSAALVLVLAKAVVVKRQRTKGGNANAIVLFLHDEEKGLFLLNFL